MDADKEQWHHARQIPDLLVNFAHSDKILYFFLSSCSEIAVAVE